MRRILKHASPQVEGERRENQPFERVEDVEPVDVGIIGRLGCANRAQILRLSNNSGIFCDCVLFGEGYFLVIGYFGRKREHAVIEGRIPQVC